MTIAAILPIAALAGCAADKFGSREQSKPDIGAAPAYATPVSVLPPRPGESPIVSGRRAFQALDKANKIISCLVEDRAATRATFLGVTAARAETETCAKPSDAVGGRRKARRAAINVR